jgi:hypothetical protein
MELTEPPKYRWNILNLTVRGRKQKTDMKVPCTYKNFKKYSEAWVHERTIPTGRPPQVGEVSANFCGERGATWLA